MFRRRVATFPLAATLSSARTGANGSALTKLGGVDVTEDKRDILQEGFDVRSLTWHGYKTGGPPQRTTKKKTDPSKFIYADIEERKRINAIEPTDFEKRVERGIREIRRRKDGNILLSFMTYAATMFGFLMVVDFFFGERITADWNDEYFAVEFTEYVTDSSSGTVTERKIKRKGILKGLFYAITSPIFQEKITDAQEENDGRTQTGPVELKPPSAFLYVEPSEQKGEIGIVGNDSATGSGNKVTKIARMDPETGKMIGLPTLPGFLNIGKTAATTTSPDGEKKVSPPSPAQLPENDAKLAEYRNVLQATEDRKRQRAERREQLRRAREEQNTAA